MIRGPLTGRRGLALMVVLAMGIAVPVILSGCGGGDKEEEATQQKPQAMVPGAEPDTAAVDTTVSQVMEEAYEAGTISDTEGVRKDPALEEKKSSGKDSKPVPAETKPQPAKTASTGDGAYSLQLGSFTNLANARNQAERIRALGYTPVIEESNLGGQLYHRVMLLRVGDMAEASRLGEHIHSELDIAYLVRRAK